MKFLRLIIIFVFINVLALQSANADEISNLLVADAGDIAGDEISESAVTDEPVMDELPLLTLGSALDIARTSNRNLLIARQAIELARAGGTSSMAQFLPDLNIAGSYTRYADKSTVTIGEGQEFTLQGIDSIFAGLFFSYPIYMGGQRDAISRENAASEEIALLQEKQVTDLIDMSTVDAYCTAREGFGGLAVHQASLESLIELERISQARYDQGYLALSDLLSIQVARAESERAVVEWTNNVQSRQSALALALGMDINSRWTLVPIDYAVVPIPFSLEMLRQWAVENRSELKEIEAERALINAQMDSIRASEGPNISLDLDYTTTSSGSDIGGASESLSGKINVYWDLYNFGRTDDLIGPLEARLEMLDIREAQTRDQILQEVELAYLSMETQLMGVQVSSQSVVQAEEALRVATRRMQEGLGMAVEVLDAQATWTRLGAASIYATHGYYRTLAMLARSVGVNMQDMVALIQSAGDENEI